MSNQEVSQKLDRILTSIEYKGDEEAFKKSFISKIYTQTFITLMNSLPDQDKKTVYANMAMSRFDGSYAPIIMNNLFTQEQIHTEIDRVSTIAVDAYIENVEETNN